MDVAKKVLLAFLEEDNEEKVFFRLLPLLDQDGSVREEAIAQWPAQGGLRIVPDRNEQYHFKDRMRTLGSFCLLDLTPFPAEANKIRTNKNFNPEKGELNQYIVYSDGIKALPEKLVFQVLLKDEWETARDGAITPLLYVKDGDGWYGPVDKKVGEMGDACPPPQGERIFEIQCPDGVTRSFYWPLETQPAAGDEASEVLEVGKPLSILDETKSFDDQLKQIAQPLSSTANLLRTGPSRPQAPMQPAPQLTGTPLYRTGGVKSSGTKAHNPLHQVVESQWRAAKYEAPSAQLKQGADMRHVDNPVDACRAALNRAWASETAQAQIVDCVLELPGMTRRLEKELLKASGEYPLQGAMHLEMEELEAERLALLVQLDKAKQDMNAFRQEALNGLNQNQKAEQERMASLTREAEGKLQKLKEELNALTRQKEALEQAVETWQKEKLPAAIAAAMAQARYLVPLVNGPLHLKVRSGVMIQSQVLIRQVMNRLNIPHDEAVNWLVLLALCPRIQIVQKKLGDAMGFVKALAAALGLEECLAVQENETQQPMMCAQLPDPAPALLATPYLQPLCQDPLVRTLWLTESGRNAYHSFTYKTAPWPVVEAPVLTLRMEKEKGDAAPAAFEALGMLLKKEEAISPSVKAFVENLHRALKGVKAAPCGEAFRIMAIYLNAASALMEGGLTAACEFACRQWLIPVAMENKELADALKSALSGLDCTALLGKA